MNARPAGWGARPRWSAGERPPPELVPWRVHGGPWDGEVWEKHPSTAGVFLPVETQTHERATRVLDPTITPRRWGKAHEYKARTVLDPGTGFPEHVLVYVGVVRV